MLASLSTGVGLWDLIEGVHGDGGTVVLDYQECTCYEYAGVCSCGGIKNGSLIILFRNTNACISRARCFLADLHRYILSAVWQSEIHPRISELVSQDTLGAASICVCFFFFFLDVSATARRYLVSSSSSL
jgi:hypothetical protein